MFAATSSCRWWRRGAPVLQPEVFLLQPESGDAGTRVHACCNQHLTAAKTTSSDAATRVFFCWNQVTEKLQPLLAPVLEPDGVKFVLAGTGKKKCWNRQDFLLHGQGNTVVQADHGNKRRR